MAQSSWMTGLCRDLCDQLSFCNPQQTNNLPSPSRRGACCTFEEPLRGCYDTRKPAIVLKNHSSSEVSFWVVQDGHKTKDITDMISNAMGESTGTSCVTLKGSTKEEIEVIQEYYDKRYILKADDRVESSEEATVPFAEGCNEMRVLGFFRKDSSKTWTRYKNKVYSIGWREKIYTLVATDENIKRHKDEEEESNGDTTTH